MGSTMSLPTIVSFALIAGGIIYGFTQKRGPPPEWAARSIEQTPAVSEKKKGKKRKGTQADSAAGSTQKTESQPTPTVVSFPAVVPGSFEIGEAAAEPATKAKGKKKKGKKAATGSSGVGGGTRATSLDAQSESSATAPESSTPVPRPAKRKSPPIIDVDGPWTRVESRKRNNAQTTSNNTQSVEQTPSDAGITTSVTGTSSPVADPTEDEQSVDAEDNRRTLAERLLPKARKTGVEDMVETPDVPALSRVMRVQPRPDEKPAVGFSWADYEDVDSARATEDDADGEDDGGWVVKSSRSRTHSDKSSVQPSQSAPESLTKKQRQNLAKREAQKSAKADAEAQRLAALAKHKKELEKLRMVEQATSKKKQGGGMSASMNEKGHLVWE